MTPAASLLDRWRRVRLVGRQAALNCFTTSELKVIAVTLVTKRIAVIKGDWRSRPGAVLRRAGPDLGKNCAAAGDDSRAALSVSALAKRDHNGVQIALFVALHNLGVVALPDSPSAACLQDQ